MFRSSVLAGLAGFAVLCVSSLALVGCADDDDDTSKPTSSTSTTQPGSNGSGDGGSGGRASGGSVGGSAGGSSLGPECKAYLACCDAIAASQPAVAASCTQTKETIEKNQGGASTASYESACKSAMSTMTASGYCK